ADPQTHRTIAREQALDHHRARPASRGAGRWGGGKITDPTTVVQELDALTGFGSADAQQSDQGEAPPVRESLPSERTVHRRGSFTSQSSCTVCGWARTAS